MWSSVTPTLDVTWRVAFVAARYGKAMGMRSLD